MSDKTANAPAAAGPRRRNAIRAERLARKQQARNRYLDYLAYLGARVAVTFLEMLGQTVGYALADVVGAALYHLDRRHRKRALGHLRLGFPHWPEQKIRRVAKASIRNMVCMGLELFLAPRCICPETWRRYIRLTNMSQVIRMLVEQKTPLVLVTGHFGNWELAGYFSAAIGLRTYTVARRLDNPYLNDFIFSVRERAGQKMIYKRGAARAVDQALEKRQAVSVVCDQDAGLRGVFVDFFGRPASTFKSIGLMAMQFDAPIAVVCCRRLGRRFRFEIFAQQVIHPHQWSGRDDPLRWITQEYTGALEQAVRAQPDQYFWIHRRWKHRPPGRKSGEDGIA